MGDVTVHPHGVADARREIGFSLLEAVVALMLFGMALLIASNALTAQAAASRRLAVRGELLRASETVLESLRGGLLPLTSGRVRLDRDLEPPADLELHTFVHVAARPTPRLYEVSVRSWTELRGVREEVELTTMVWRP